MTADAPRVTVARETGARLDDAVDVLLRAEPWLAYANFPPIADRGDGALGLHRRHWRTATHALVARDADARPVAVVRLDHRDFESRHFGLRMAGLAPVAAVADETVRLAALRALYRAALAALRDDGYQHVAATTATQDRCAYWALQELGCFHVGTKISWMAPLTGAPVDEPLPAPLRIEVLDATTIPSLPRASWRRLLDWTATAFDRGPLVFDLGVPSDRAAAVYQVWTEKALTGEWAEVLLVVWDGDEIVAFNSMQRLPDLSEAAGIPILGRGIGASLPGHRGLFTALQQACAAVRPLHAGFLENETQSSTLPSIQVFGKLGHRCIRSIGSFHRRLDGAR